MRGYLSRGITKEPLIGSTPADDLSIICAIPCYNEPDITTTLTSILEASKGHSGIEVIVLVNESTHDTEDVISQNRRSLEEIRAFSLAHETPWIYGCHKVFEDKKAGVGRARKTAMDEACHRFIKLEKEDGLIVCTDADAVVPKIYFVQLYKILNEKAIDHAYSFGFCHDIDDPILGPNIIDYELHLRYFKHAKDYIGHPHSCYTVGSAMAANYKGYILQMGMNIRKAGEDFYFLQKFAKAGKLKSDSSIVIRPSSRISDRVPFGTGRAMGEMIEHKKRQYTYAWESFVDVKQFFIGIDRWYAGNELKIKDIILLKFLEKENYLKHLGAIKQHSTDLIGFRKRFFYWFDAFKLMKYLHFAREEGREDIPVLEAINIRMAFEQKSQFLNEKSALQFFRKMDLGPYFIQ